MRPVLVWLGHAGFRIEGSSIVYIDPYRIKEQNPPKADYILVTHSHYDHLSDADIRKIVKDTTTLISTPDCIAQFKGKKAAIKPGEELEFGTLKVKAVPAYNLTKSFHQKSSGWVGFLVTLDDITFYHSGDSDAIPEMADIKADVVLLPVGGTYTMDAQEAAEVASKINPRVAIPMHYGAIIGSANDAIQFKRYATCPVKILTEGERWEVNFSNL